MTQTNNVNNLPATFHIVPIARGPNPKKWKAPSTYGWNTDDNAALYSNQVYEGFNAGLCHKQSGTCTIDADNLRRCIELFAERHLDLQQYLDAGVQIVSGKANRAKLVYRLPFLMVMNGDLPITRQIIENGEMILEFRCISATGNTVQDVIPPSIHPDTQQPYQWVGDPNELTEIPSELLQWWQSLAKVYQQECEGWEGWEGVEDTEDERGKVRRALRTIDSDTDYNNWFNIGMALHDTGWEDAFDLWDEWSSEGSTYDAEDTYRKWQTFTHGYGIKLSKLYAIAYAADKAWDLKLPSEMFSEIQPITIDHATQQPAAAPILGMPDSERLAKCANNGLALDVVAHLQTYLDLCYLAAGCATPESKNACVKALQEITSQPIQAIRDRVAQFTAEQSSPINNDIIERYLHIKTMHKFYDTTNHTIISAESLNQSWESGDDLAQEEFKQAGGVSADVLSWIPCAHYEQPRKIINRGHLAVANTYEKPEEVPAFLSGEVKGFLDHAEFMIPDAAEREVVFDHMAFTMQHPEIKINWQILLFGVPGTGKDTLLLPLAKYFGSMYRDIKAGDDEANKWGDTFFKKKVLVYQEVYRPRDTKFANDLKTLAASTAGGMDELNLKGKGQVQQPNLYSMYMFSNHADALHLDKGDRRVFPVGDLALEKPKGNYFDVLYDWLNNGGLLRVVRWFLERDVSRFNPNRLPFHTTAREQMVEQSRSEASIAIEEEAMRGAGPFDPERSVFTSKQVARHIQDRGERFVGVHAVANELAAMGFEKLPRASKTVGGRKHTIRVWRNPAYVGHTSMHTAAAEQDDLTTHHGVVDAYLRCSFGL